MTTRYYLIYLPRNEVVSHHWTRYQAEQAKEREGYSQAVQRLYTIEKRTLAEHPEVPE